MEAITYNTIAFQNFLQYIVNEKPQTHIVIILNNTRIHYAKLLKLFPKKEQPTADINLFTTLFTEFKFTRTYLEVAKRNHHF